MGLCVADGEHLPPALFSLFCFFSFLFSLFLFSVAAAIGLLGGFRVDRPLLCSIVQHPSKEAVEGKKKKEKKNTT